MKAIREAISRAKLGYGSLWGLRRGSTGWLSSRYAVQTLATLSCFSGGQAGCVGEILQPLSLAQNHVAYASPWGKQIVLILR